MVAAIDTFIDERDIDIIVMGTRGKKNNPKLTFGSNTLQVLKYAKCPVLVIPKDYTYKVPKKLVFSTDFFMPYQQKELHFLLELVAYHKSEIDVLYVSEMKTLSLKEEKNKYLIAESLNNNNTCFNSIDGKDIAKTISSYIKNHYTDILVMTNRKHSFLENILFQDTINKIGLTIGIPFLVLQNIKCS